MRWIMIVAALAVPMPAAAQDSTRATAPQGNPLRGVVRLGNTLYLAGQAGTIPGSKGQIAPGGTPGEVKQTLENIKRVLEREGSSLEKVAKCTVYLTNIADFQAMNDVYRTFFPKDPPARTTVQVAALARPDLHVEIECIAAAGDSK